MTTHAPTRPLDFNAGSPDPAPTAACHNCGAPVASIYCGACGQRFVDLDASTWHVVREALGDATDVDGRILRTGRALLSPGRITVEFRSGRRAPYLGPLKLFLLAGTVLTTTWILTRGADAHYYGFRPGGFDAAAYIDGVVRGAMASGFAIAVSSWALSRGRRRFLDEAVFALNLVAALALWSSVAIWLGTAWKLAWGTVAVVPATVPNLIYLVYLPACGVGLAYLALAVRRVHGGRWWAVALRSAVIAIAGIVAVTAVIAFPALMFMLRKAISSQ